MKDKLLIINVLVMIMTGVFAFFDFQYGYQGFPYALILFIVSLGLWSAYTYLDYGKIKKWQVFLVFGLSLIEAISLSYLRYQVSSDYPVDRFVGYVLSAYGSIVVLVNEGIYLIISLIKKVKTKE